MYISFGLSLSITDVNQIHKKEQLRTIGGQVTWRKILQQVKQTCVQLKIQDQS